MPIVWYFVSPHLKFYALILAFYSRRKVIFWLGLLVKLWLYPVIFQCFSLRLKLYILFEKRSISPMLVTQSCSWSNRMGSCWKSIQARILINRQLSFHSRVFLIERKYTDVISLSKKKYSSVNIVFSPEMCHLLKSKSEDCFATFNGAIERKAFPVIHIFMDLNFKNCVPRLVTKLTL